MPESILIVEDDRDFCRLLNIYLGRTYNITIAHTVAEAENLLARERFCCVLFDVTLPDKPGWELLPAIRSSPANTTPIVMTGLSDTATAERAAAFGLEHIITKPATPMQIKAILNQILDA